MTTEELLEKTKELIAIPSTVDNPKALEEALEYLADFVRKRNPQATIEYFTSNGSRSLLAYKGKKRPAKFHVLLNGHVDVIPGKPEQFKAEIKDDKLYGRGSYDMKAACVVMAEVFCEFVDKVPFNLGLQMVADEEIGGLDGTYHQIQEGVRAEFAICGECGRQTDKAELANEGKGTVFADIAFDGQTAHGAYPWRGDNPTVKAAHFVKALHESHPTPTEEEKGTTITVTGIVSDTGAHNKIPERAIVKLDARFIPSDQRFKTKEAFADFIKSIDPSAEVAGLQLFRQPMYSDPNGVFIKSLKQAAETVEAQSFQLVRRHGGSDACHFIEAGGQACEFGVAGEDQHGNNEHVTLKAFEHYHQTLREFLSITAKSAGLR